MTVVVVGLGANLGDPAENLNSALAALRGNPKISQLTSSSLVRSQPLGGKAQPAYCNAVARFQWSGAAMELLRLLQGLEKEAGRERGAERWASRPLDLDILAFGDSIIEDVDLSIPHPQICQRSFVVQPWLEIDPNAQLATGEKLADLPAAYEAGLSPWVEIAANSRII